MKNGHLRQGMTSPQDEAHLANNAAELQKHRKLIHHTMELLRNEVLLLLKHLPPQEEREITEPLKQSLARVTAAFSLETTLAINGELVHQIEAGAVVLGQMAHLIDWARDMEYLTRDNYERILKQVAALMLGAANLKWILTGRQSVRIQRRSCASLPASFH